MTVVIVGGGLSWLALAGHAALKPRWRERLGHGRTTARRHLPRAR